MTISYNRLFIFIILNGFFCGLYPKTQCMVARFVFKRTLLLDILFISFFEIRPCPRLRLFALGSMLLQFLIFHNEFDLLAGLVGRMLMNFPKEYKIRIQIAMKQQDLQKIKSQKLILKKLMVLKLQQINRCFPHYQVNRHQPE